MTTTTEQSALAALDTAEAQAAPIAHQRAECRARLAPKLATLAGKRAALQAHQAEHGALVREVHDVLHHRFLTRVLNAAGPAASRTLEAAQAKAHEVQTLAASWLHTLNETERAAAEVNRAATEQALLTIERNVADVLRLVTPEALPAKLRELGGHCALVLRHAPALVAASGEATAATILEPLRRCAALSAAPAPEPPAPAKASRRKAAA